METAGELGARPVPPECLLAHLHRFLRIYDAGEGAAAVRHAKRAIATGDRADAAWVTVGVVYTKQGKTEQAVDAFHEGGAPESAQRGSAPLARQPLLGPGRPCQRDAPRRGRIRGGAQPTSPTRSSCTSCWWRGWATSIRHSSSMPRRSPSTRTALSSGEDSVRSSTSSANSTTRSSPVVGRPPSIPARADYLVDQAWALVGMQQPEAARELVERAVALMMEARHTTRSASSL